MRWDGGYMAGDEVSQYYDNLVGKLVVWAHDRATAIARMERAIREFRIEGIKTTLPADLAILDHEDFKAARHSTKWVEEVLDLSGVGGEAVAPPVTDGADEPEEKVRRDVDVEVNGKRFAVTMCVPASSMAPVAGDASGGGGLRPRRKGTSGGAAAAVGSGSVVVPMQGTIVKVTVEVGDEVTTGQTVCLLEAMKMENTIAADKAGKVTEIKVEAGQAVNANDVVLVIE